MTSAGCHPSSGPISVSLGSGFAWTPTYVEPPPLSIWADHLPYCVPASHSEPVQECLTCCASPTPCIASA